jgi:Zn-dependent peptidase ImmA (M78 family)
MKNGWRSGAARAILRRGEHSEMRCAIRAVVAGLLSGSSTMPTDLFAVGERLGVSITRELISGSGELRHTPKGLEVVVNPEQPQPRQRFTIAHELGHAIIQQLHPSADQRKKEIERLCDLFAVELLMPEESFRQQLPREVTLPDVQRLARQYQTSLLATAHRCAELSSMMVVVVMGGKIEQVSGALRDSAAWKDEQFLSIAQQASDGQKGTTQLFLTHNYSVLNWKVQFQPLGKTGRALLLLTRAALPGTSEALR